MADNRSHVGKAVLIALSLVILFIILSMSVYEIGFVDQSMVIGWGLTTKIAAGVITVIALIGALTAAYRNDEAPWSAMVPWVVMVLGGALVLEPNWGTGLGLGAAVAAMVWVNRPPMAEQQEEARKPPARKPRRPRSRSRSTKSDAKK